MRKSLKVSAIALLAGLMAGASFPLFAQTSGGVDVASLRSPFVAGVSYSVKIQTESLNPTTGKLVLNTGQLKDLGAFNPISDSVLLAEIQGPKTAGAKTIVAAIRATFTVAGALGIDVEPGVVHIKLPNVELPAGQTLALRYDMPVLGAGKVQWKVGAGAKASDIPAPAAPGPIVSGPIAQPTPPATPAPDPVAPPAPASPSSPSAAGSCITPTGAPVTDCAAPLASLVDSTGGTWKLTATSATRDGVETRAALDNFGYWPLAYIFIRPTGVLCGFNSSHGFICWTAGKWQ